MEAALIAADYAPGLLRDYYGFIGWKQHNAEIWKKVLSEAEQRQTEGLKNMPVIIGFDQNRRAINAANDHIERAGLQGKIHIERRDISEAKPAAGWTPGLIICNPPYGIRIGNPRKLRNLYASLGNLVRRTDPLWRLALITSNDRLARATGVDFHRTSEPIPHGGLRVRLYSTQ